jgi:Flp pilus assembly protein TadB
MTELVVALIAAGGALAAAWWSQPGRRAIGIRRYVELLNDLPAKSKQRKRLAKEIDKMVDGELLDRRFNEIAQAVWAIFAFGVIASVTTSIARSHGGAGWWILSIVYWALTAAMAGAFVFGLWRRRKKRTDKSSKPAQVTPQ